MGGGGGDGVEGRVGGGGEGGRWRSVGGREGGLGMEGGEKIGGGGRLRQEYVGRSMWVAWLLACCSGVRVSVHAHRRQAERRCNLCGCSVWLLVGGGS